MSARPAWVGEVARFGFVGVSSALLDFGILSGLIHLGASPYSGRIVSVAASVIYTWWLNRTMTFATAAPPTWREFAHYVAVAMAGILLNLGIYWAALYLGAPTWAAFVLGTGLTAVFSFVRYKALLGQA